MTLKTEYDAITPYRTKDRSIIRELMHPDVHGNSRMSLAEATVPEGRMTLLHRHHQTEEVYHITRGEGLMVLGRERLRVSSGDTVCIPPETPHQICNTGKGPLILLCCSSPAYSHDDTELLPQKEKGRDPIDPAFF